MHFHILGVGPIGCLLAHNLRRILPTTHSISLIHKTIEDHRRLLEKGELTIERAGQKESSHEFSHEVFHESRQTSASPRVKSDAATPQLKNDPIDSVFVALKAHHTIPALQALAPRLSTNSTIVLFQNGMGIYERLLVDVFRNPSQRPHFVLASNTHGAFATNFYHVVHAGVGTIEFGIAPDSTGRDFEAGLFDENVEEGNRRLRLADISPTSDTRYSSLRTTVAAMLLLESLNASWKSFSDLQVTMRRKLVVNAVINPITSLMGCRNGELVGHDRTQPLLERICDEASTVYHTQMRNETAVWLKQLESQGINTADVPALTFPESLTSQSLQQEVIRVAQLTKGNISSMLQDVRRGRETEIDFINGYLADVGRDHGVDTPVNSALLDLVKLKYIVPLSQ